MGHYDSNHIQGLVRPDRVHRDVYTDPKIFEMEMDRLWHKAWIYVGHASQVPTKGDYVTTSVGLEPVIMVRGKDDEVNVIYNRCAHKGAKVAVKPCGNTKGFRCPYHGWTYKLDGALRGVPARSGYDGSDFDVNDPQFHMQKVARVANCRGFIFACLSNDGPGFEEFLGMRWRHSTIWWIGHQRVKLKLRAGYTVIYTTITGRCLSKT